MVANSPERFERHYTLNLAAPAKPIASGEVVWRWIDIQA
jgi:hypothetical protein